MEELSPREKYSFKRKLEELEAIKGQHTELITLYIPPDKQIYDVVAQLRDEYSQSSNIKSKTTRKNVLSAIESIQSKLRYFKKPPKNGVVFFVGEALVGRNQTRMVSEILEPPYPISIYLYRCDSQFFLEPLEEMIKDIDTYGLFLIDRRECTIGLLIGTRIEPVSYLTSRVPGKHGRGGQSQRRFERLIEIAAHEWFVKCAGKALEVFKEQKDLKGILVGGPGPTKRTFVNEEYLQFSIQKKIIGIFDTGYTDDYGLKELVNNAAKSLEKLEIAHEKEIMNSFLEKIRDESGLAVYGEKEVRKALEMGAVDTLILSGGLRKYHIWQECNQCGYKEDKTVEKIEDETCPKCASPLEVIQKKDIIDDLSKKADEISAKVEIISLESEEGDTLQKAFGGIAGILRYEVNIPET